MNLETLTQLIQVPLWLIISLSCLGIIAGMITAIISVYVFDNVLMKKKEKINKIPAKQTTRKSNSKVSFISKIKPKETANKLVKETDKKEEEIKDKMPATQEFQKQEEVKEIDRLIEYRKRSK